MTREEAINELKMAFTKFNAIGLIDNNRKTAFKMAIKALKEPERKHVRCCECGFHVDYDGIHSCKFFNRPCPDDSEFYCKAGLINRDDLIAMLADKHGYLDGADTKSGHVY